MTHRITLLVGCFATLALAACASTSSASGAAPGDTAETPARLAATRVTGSVLYRERIALTPDAVVQVEVVELSPDGSAGAVVGEQTLRAPGQVPIPFSVEVDPEHFRPETGYAVRARITDGGRVFSSPAPVPVLTQGHPSQDVQVLVRIGE